MKDYYGLLGVGRDATAKEIKKNYRMLAVKYHPDKNDDPDAPTKFMAITEAYEILSKKNSRTKYDLFAWEQLKRKTANEDPYDYEVVVPPHESTRTRRNKAQKKRSEVYHKEESTAKKIVHLIAESGYIVSRYYLHVIGLTLAVVILNSVISHLRPAFDENLIRGIFLLIIISAIIYTIFIICKNAFLDYAKDLEVFSFFYKLSKLSATVYTLAIFAIFLSFYLLVLIKQFS